nr:very short patch repair endonuclease [Nitrosomonas nitrosa]
MDILQAGPKLDIVDPATRSRMMSRVRGRDTGPERLVRSLLHGMGYRFRLQGRGLPGRPDIVFAGRRKAVFVHGCFWHGHDGCRFAYQPKTRAAWWRAKIDATRMRDARSAAALTELGWRSFIVWECECRDLRRLRESLRRFLGGVRIKPVSRKRGTR